jgi:FkbM family methyltransferase
MLKAIHMMLRGPYYDALCLVYPRGVKVELPGQHFVRLHPRLLGIRVSEYELDFSTALYNRIAPGMTVIDVGAHVGLHTLRLSREVGKTGRVIAVEPSPANASLLRKHLAWNGCENVLVVEAAVGECSGEIDFAFRPDPTDPGGFANSIAYDIGGDKARIRVTTIDEICFGLTPNVIKIDVEGAELLAIRGARDVLSRSSPALFVAIHPEAMRALGTSPVGLLEVLRECGYAGRHVDGSLATEPGFSEILFEKAATAIPPTSCC